MFRTDRKDGRVRMHPVCFWCILFLAAVLLQVLARQAPGFAEWYAKSVYPGLMRVLGGVSGIFPFALDEVLIFLMVCGVCVYIIRGVIRIRKRDIAAGRWALDTVRRLLKAGIVWIFAFTVTCGINYHRTPFSSLAGLPMEPSTVEELTELCLWLTEEIETTAASVKTEEDGLAALPEGLTEKTRDAMRALGRQYPELSGWYPKAKPVFAWKILSLEFLEGIYGPYTMEAHYNPDIPAYNQPAVLCHELSHLRGFMREDEANYIAYLACSGSEDANIRYSGLLLAYTHSINALCKADYERFAEVRSRLCEQANRDYAYHRAYWAQYEGPVSELSDKVNDTYLRANAQQAGSRSYGRMVDLLLGAYRRQKKAEAG